MKKLVMVTVLLVAGVAFASSLSVPWFVDTFNFGTVTDYTNVGYPPINARSLTIEGFVYVHNTTDADKLCYIEYYSKLGDFRGPAYPNNTFIIGAMSTVSFRPNAIDPADGVTNAPGGVLGLPNGQEDAVGVLVPTWPKPVITERYGPGGMYDNANGSLVVRWAGVATDVQGNYIELWGVDPAGAGARMNAFAALIPAGVGGGG